VVDLGYGAFRNLQKAVSPAKINLLLFTHFVHADHTVDLIAFLEERYAQMRHKGREKKQLAVFGPSGMREFFKKVQSLYPNFSEFPFGVKIEELDYSEKELFGFKVKPKPVEHEGVSIAYRIEADGKAFVYSGDTRYCQSIIDLGAGADLLALDCSYPEKKTDKHLNALECGEIAQKAGAKALLLTHFFPESEGADIKSIAAKNFSGRIIVAEDLLKVDI
jgi:ribonuclease BN (tRNA processing enzyme)